MQQNIEKILKMASIKAGINDPKIHLEHPAEISHGDFSSNVAMIHAKDLKTNPKNLAEKIVEELKKDLPENISSIDVAGPGFINIKLNDKYFAEEVLKIDEDFGKGTHDKGKRIMVEYTDPNPFKIFHIGHLMANAIGESISRIVEFSGAKVVRANYYGDVGLHVAKTLWAILQKKDSFPDESVLLIDRIRFLGEMYVLGNEKYDAHEAAKNEIIAINRKIFEKSDPEINNFYKIGRKWSLEYFESIYKKLGTKFDYYFPESDVAMHGVKIVEDNLKKGIFKESEGAIIFPGEDHGVHTRVFITSQNLPTYEAKELGLTKKKFEVEPKLSESIVVTANEQNDYFKVLLKALSFIYPEIAQKTKHISHGMFITTSGKMSSRKGSVVAAETLIEDMEKLVDEKIKERGFDKNEESQIREYVSIAALKYAILRQAIGSDVVYDPEKAVSFEGDSGPYLQYACVRAKNVLVKAKEAKIAAKIKEMPSEVTLLERLLARFPEVISRARDEYSPHFITTYLTELAAAFNAYYANNQIIDPKNPLSPYRIALTKSFVSIMTNGLWLLGMKIPEKM